MVRKMVKDQKPKDRKILNMIEHISQKQYQVSQKLDLTWMKFTELGYPQYQIPNCKFLKTKWNGRILKKNFAK
ncbi:unnamed protein product [Paramecium sonneborni]|uniref:Uncharacterized protein n=1 Tax=Paramecium sonneborni TaxID=65129 RepID=A0A8S1RRU4_9CILI|nr:unnamed protein product [Paramecium sonneborni]